MHWKKIKKTNFTNIEKLADFLELSPRDRKEITAFPKFPLNLPLRFAKKISKGTLEDPLLRQFLPLKKELKKQKGFLKDPVGDLCSQKEKKLLHKYPGRALLLLSSACAMHCRYCFRRDFPYQSSKTGFEKELAYIRDDSSIEEVILSGGDPLSLDGQVLEALLQSVESISHVKRLRIHSRFIVAIPERVDEQFLKMLEKSRLKIFFVLHCNLAQELDKEVIEAVDKLQKKGVVVLNQAVLLKSVNDNYEALKQLSDHLANHGIIFYYLHQLDRVEGAAHFEVSEEKGLALIQKLRETSSGYAVPRYVREVSGEPSKTPL